ncbi:MAG: rhodanese-like domain-containing protein [Gammaproteobacteria bacterium]
MMARTYWRRSLSGFLLALVLTATGCGTEPAGGPIAAADLAARIENGTAPVIFDVRTATEYADGHVPGAVLLPHTEVAERADEFSVFRDLEVVVYCRSGKRAGMAEADLVAAGFTRVRNLEGHMLEWQAGGYPLE